MMNLDWLRTLVVGGAVVATLGSASSQQQPPPSGYYPQPQAQTQAQAQPQPQPQPQPYAPPQQPQPQPQAQAQAQTAPPPANTCEGVCDQIVRCDVGAFDDCMQECAKAGATPDQLATLSRSSCAQLSAMAQQPAPPPPAPPPAPAPQQAPTPPEGKRTQWVCNASGMWQKCESQGFSCYPSTTTMLGFGPNEGAARANAVSVCSTAMSRMMSVNFAYRTSVTSPCRVMMCTPPNAK